jgi:hypothetical protein
MKRARLSDNKTNKTKMGRLATGIGTLIGHRWHEPDLAAIDEWRRRQDDLPSRSEAIRRLAEPGLAGARPMRRRSPKAASKASDMAGQQIDKLGDSSATDEERQQRKRRLLKGPKEFRDMRGDLPEPKG